MTAAQLVTASADVVTHNAYSAGNSQESIRRNLVMLVDDSDRPDVIIVTEAWRLRGSIGGYLRVGPDWSRDRNLCSTIVLVRADHEVTRRRLIRVDGPSWWWNGNRRPPRIFVDVTVRIRGVLFDVLGVHRTPGGPDAGIIANRASWAAEHREILAWRRRRRRANPDRPRVVAGDHNDRLATRVRRSVRALARRLGARAALRGIDGLLAINARVSRVRELRGRYGSDAHNPVWVRVTAVLRPRRGGRRG